MRVESVSNESIRDKNILANLLDKSTLTTERGADKGDIMQSVCVGDVHP